MFRSIWHVPLLCCFIPALVGSHFSSIWLGFVVCFAILGAFENRRFAEHAKKCGVFFICLSVLYLGLSAFTFMEPTGNAIRFGKSNDFSQYLIWGRAMWEHACEAPLSNYLSANLSCHGISQPYHHVDLWLLGFWGRVFNFAPTPVFVAHLAAIMVATTLSSTYLIARLESSGAPQLRHLVAAIFFHVVCFNFRADHANIWFVLGPWLHPSYAFNTVFLLFLILAIKTRQVLPVVFFAACVAVNHLLAVPGAVCVVFFVGWLDAFRNPERARVPWEALLAWVTLGCTSAALYLQLKSHPFLAEKTTVNMPTWSGWLHNVEVGFWQVSPALFSALFLLAATKQTRRRQVLLGIGLLCEFGALIMVFAAARKQYDAMQFIMLSLNTFVLGFWVSCKPPSWSRYVVMAVIWVANGISFAGISWLDVPKTRAHEIQQIFHEAPDAKILCVQGKRIIAPYMCRNFLSESRLGASREHLLITKHAHHWTFFPPQPDVEGDHLCDWIEEHAPLVVVMQPGAVRPPCVTQEVSAATKKLPAVYFKAKSAL